MTFVNYYDILSIKCNASEQEIKKSYRNMALKMHPDINKTANSHQRFIEIKEAYDMLIDVEKRRVYDSLLKKHLNSVIVITTQSAETELNYSKYSGWRSESVGAASDQIKTGFVEFSESIRSIRKGFKELLGAIFLAWIVGSCGPYYLYQTATNVIVDPQQFIKMSMLEVVFTTVGTIVSLFCTFIFYQLCKYLISEIK